MNLDDFKSIHKQQNAPPGGPSGDARIGSFIAELRQHDSNQRRKALLLAGGQVSLGVCLLAIGGEGRPGTTLIGAGSLFVALYSGLRAYGFGRVDYAAPTRQFLADAARRYQFWRLEDTLIAIPILLTLGLGGGITVWLAADKYLSPSGLMLAMTAYTLFFLGTCVFGWIASRGNWRREHATTVAEIRRQLEGIDPDRV
jgi:hypothetical protein